MKINELQKSMLQNKELTFQDKLAYVSQELSEIRKICKDNEGASHDKLFNMIWHKFSQLEDYATENNVPLNLYVTDIILDYCSLEGIEFTDEDC